jgi:hypothetical protein
VRDHGIGISREEQRSIFERFHTTGDMQLHSTSKTAYRGGGIGLGLAICRGIIEAHGGRIWVESDGYSEKTLPGSNFQFVIPLMIERPNVQTTQAAIAAAEASSTAITSTSTPTASVNASAATPTATAPTATAPQNTTTKT